METCTSICGTRELHIAAKKPRTSSLTTKIGAIGYCCQQGDVSQGEQVVAGQGESVLSKLPEDVFDHLYSLMPLQDAARAACVSCGFLHSWRRYPRIVLNNKALSVDRLWHRLTMDTRASEDKQYKEQLIESHFVDKINHVFGKRSDVGVVKAFTLHLHPCPNMEASYIDKWLGFALKPGIEELAFQMSILEKRAEYNFPCSLLSNETGGSSLQSLHLVSCAFHPRRTLGCSKSLTSLYLYYVHITGQELGRFVSSCAANLAQLLVCRCDDIVCFRATCVLQNLNFFHVSRCQKLRVVEINAPKLSNFGCGDSLISQISLGAEVKHITMTGSRPNTIRYARIELPSFMPSVERLTVESNSEKVMTPMMPSKFLHLKYLNIYLVDVQLHRQDYYCLVSFLEASPALETFILRVQTDNALRYDSVFRDLDKAQLHLRQMPECSHHNLKNVMITGFTSAKSPIELTRHIVENALALECLTLDTAISCGRRTSAKTDNCWHMSEEALREAQKGVEAVRRCIEGIVLPSANFKALEPCSECGCQGPTCSLCKGSSV